MPELSRMLVKRWLNGRPAEIWISHLSTVEALVKEYKLKPLDPEHYPTMDIFHHLGPMDAYIAQAHLDHKAAKKVPVTDPRPFPGGLRIPHLHYKDDIYLLDDKHWKDFSNRVIRTLKDKLIRAKALSFDQLVEASTVLGNLP